MNPLISIVTGTHNRLEPLQQMVASVRLNMPVGIPYEIILVDGGSTDGTVEWASQQSDIRFFKGDLDGAIKAFCFGAQQSRAKYVLMANDDIFFFPDSILPAIAHLETMPTCGAVAFADNRHPEYKKHQYDVAYMTAQAPWDALIYAQVGLFRRWLGDKIGWWGYGTVQSKTYGGDNYLSAKIWELGFSVDKVAGCVIHDTIIEDGLRKQNREYNDVGYHKIYPNGPKPSATQLIPQEDESLFRVLYLPIFENHAKQKAGKRGLREAFSRFGLCVELDYLNDPEFYEHLIFNLKTLKPHMVFTQFHGVDKHSKEITRLVKQIAPTALLVNWNGDYWPHGLTTTEMITLLNQFDLQLVVNADSIPTYDQQAIRAAYWQIAAEPVSEGAVQKHMLSLPKYDVVFLGNNNSLHGTRAELEQMLMNMDGISYRLDGQGWKTQQNDSLYDFALGRAIYRNSKIAISDTIPESNRGFVSNRFFEAIAAGGCVVFQQHIPGFDELTGFEAGRHYIEWRSIDDLYVKINRYLDNPWPIEKIDKVTKYAHQHHSFDNRLLELLDLLESHAKRELGGVTVIINRKSRRGGGLLGPVTGTHYVFEPGIPLPIDSRDAEAILRRAQSWERYDVHRTAV